MFDIYDILLEGHLKFTYTKLLMNLFFNRLIDMYDAFQKMLTQLLTVILIRKNFTIV